MFSETLQELIGRIMQATGTQANELPCVRTTSGTMLLMPPTMHRCIFIANGLARLGWEPTYKIRKVHLRAIARRRHAQRRHLERMYAQRYS